MATLAGEAAREFWIVDPKSQTSIVYTRQSGMRVYGPGASVPVNVAGGGEASIVVF